MPNDVSRIQLERANVPNQVREEKSRAIATAQGLTPQDTEGGLLGLYNDMTSSDSLGSGSIRVNASGETGTDLEIYKTLAGVDPSEFETPLPGSGVLLSTEQKKKLSAQFDKNPGSALVGSNSATYDATNNPYYGSAGSMLTRKESMQRVLAGASLPSNAPTAYQSVTGTNSTIPNQLEDFVSYNCILSLGVLTTASINDPQNTYRKNGADFTIARTGGGGIDNKRITTAFEEDGNLEYFIDDFNMSSILSPNNRTGMSTATKLSFKVQEPYSLGLFLQSLEIAAKKANYLNYLDAPYLLEIDFIGWDEHGNSKPVEFASRKIPFKLYNVQFDVESGGSTYEVSGFPWNEQSLSDTTQRINDPVSIRGSTVADALSFGEQSLSAILNKKLREIAEKEGMPATNLYVIRFPKTLARSATNTRSSDTEQGATVSIEAPNNSNVISTEQYLTRVDNFFGEKSSSANNNIYQTLTGSSTTDINRIGQSRMVLSSNEGTDRPFPLSNFAYDRVKKIYARNGIEISPDERLFKFPQGMSIQKIIEEMVLISNYTQSALENPDNEGMITWFKIEVECFVLDIPNVEAITGSKPKVYVYNVVPYRVHSSVMVPPNKGLTGEAPLARQVSKEYNYIYTGANKDVLKFDIEFNTAFFEALRADRYNQGAGSINPASTSTVSPDPEPELGRDTTPGDNLSPTSQTKDSDATSWHTGGSAETSAKKNLAKQFHHLLLNSNVDLITANVDIWGDPYYIPDSGLGNYSARNSGQKLTLTEDGTLDYQRNEVDILVNFRTPVDYNKQGVMEFQSDTTLVKGFSGFYKVTTVETSISGNQFTQALTLIRRKNQSVEGVSKNRTVVEKQPTSRSGNAETQPEIIGNTPGRDPREGQDLA